MSGATPLPPSPTEQVRLLAAARTMNDPWGVVLELCILTLCLPWEAVAIELERIDWDRGYVPVPSRSIEPRVLALPLEAQRTILRVAGAAAGRGQAVTAGRGVRLQAKLVRMDRLLDRLAAACPSSIALPPWNMHGIRLAGERALRANGASDPEIAATLGRHSGTAAKGLRGDVDLARLGAERWNAVLASARPAAASPQSRAPTREGRKE